MMFIHKKQNYFFYVSKYDFIYKKLSLLLLLLLIVSCFIYPSGTSSMILNIKENFFLKGNKIVQVKIRRFHLLKIFLLLLIPVIVCVCEKFSIWLHDDRKIISGFSTFHIRVNFILCIPFFFFNTSLTLKFFITFPPALRIFQKV